MRFLLIIHASCRLRQIFTAATTALVFGVSVLSSISAYADVDYAFAARLGLGGGIGIGPGDATNGIFEMAPRGELLFGDNFAIGPAFELRTANFQTAELTAGVTSAIPLGDSETAILASIGGGYAWCHDEPDRTILTTSLGWGLFNKHWRWAASTTLYVSFRHALTAPTHHEITAGISFGGGILNMLLRIGRM